MLKDTLMHQEALEAPDVVKKQLSMNRDLIKKITTAVPLKNLQTIVTCARGSSDHAAAYAKYLFEIVLGVPVVSLGPSIGSIYKQPMNLKNSLFIVISQSGQSPDLVSCTEWAKEQGAYVVGIINEGDTPIHNIADIILPLHAGKEISVAATKSYIASLTAAAMLVAGYSPNHTLSQNIKQLPDKLKTACSLNWDHVADKLAPFNDLYVVGRGVSYGVALEAALKFKETCMVHAEGFSSAELMHGPLALIRDQYPVLVFSQNDETRDGTREIATSLIDKKATVFTTDDYFEAINVLPTVDTFHPYLMPIVMIQQFYLMVNRLSLLKGLNPDTPTHLAKVTETK